MRNLGLFFKLEEQLSKLQAEYDAVTMDTDFKVSEYEVKIENLEEERKRLEAVIAEQKA